MPTVDECEAALHQLADRLGAHRDAEDDDAKDDAKARIDDTPDRTISYAVRDLGVVFTGRFEQGRLTEVRRSTAGRTGEDAQIRFDTTGADLIGLVDGSLDVTVAWVTGRLKVGASFRDLIRLRSLL